MKFFLIAGEPSGDLHASNLICALRKQQPEATFEAMGGDLMQAQGATLVQHYKNMAFMGIVPVLLNLDKVRANFRMAKEALLRSRPDMLILVDYPSFNLKIAKFVKAHLPQTRVCYYISPKLWAWKTYRIRSIKKYIDDMYTIFPFETEFYARYNYPVHYVGNPLMDSIAARPDQTETFAEFTQRNHLSAKPIIALLAGSRRQEIAKCLPRMIAAARRADYQLVVAGAPGQDADFYRQFDVDVPVVFGQTYQLLQQATAAVVNSGTATLETALIGTPQVVVYNVVMPTFASLVKPILIKTRYVSLVNIIAGHEVVKELLARDFTEKNVRTEVDKLLADANYVQTMKTEYARIQTLLGGQGAAATAAQQMLQSLANKK